MKDFRIYCVQPLADTTVSLLPLISSLIWKSQNLAQPLMTSRSYTPITASTCTKGWEGDYGVDTERLPSSSFVVCLFFSNRPPFVFALSWNFVSDFNPELTPRAQRTWETILPTHNRRHFQKWEQKHLHDLFTPRVSWNTTKEWIGTFCGLGWEPEQVWPLTATRTQSQKKLAKQNSARGLQGALRFRLLPSGPIRPKISWRCFRVARVCWPRTLSAS